MNDFRYSAFGHDLRDFVAVDGERGRTTVDLQRADGSVERVETYPGEDAYGKIIATGPHLIRLSEESEAARLVFSILRKGWNPENARNVGAYMAAQTVAAYGKDRGYGTTSGRISRSWMTAVRMDDGSFVVVGEDGELGVAESHDALDMIQWIIDEAGDFCRVEPIDFSLSEHTR